MEFSCDMLYFQIGKYCSETGMNLYFQAAAVKDYPEEMTIVFFYTLFLTCQCSVISLIVERNPDAWKLKPGIEMIAIVYAVRKTKKLLLFYMLNKMFID